MDGFKNRLAALDNLDVPVSQNESELEWAWHIVKTIRPRAFLELGCLSGGSLFVYAAACAPGAKIIGVDVARSQKHGENLARVVDALQSEGYDVLHMDRPTNDRSTVDCVKQALPVIDVCHIDANHKYSAVKTDYEWYGVLVRRGGLVLLHDVGGDATGPGRVWNEVKNFTCKRALCCGRSGIGIVEV